MSNDARRTPGTPEHKAAQLAGSMRMEGFTVSADEERYMVEALQGKIDIEAEILKTVQSCKTK